MKDFGYAISDGSRFNKARKIVACLEYVDDLKGKNILEIGCGSGIIAYEISKKANAVTALDVIENTFVDAMKNIVPSEMSLSFVKGNGENLPFHDCCFDTVICNQVFEHVKNQKELISEILRVLKVSGLCYIATGNKLWPLEPHAKLPFLSMMPGPIADRYIKMFRGISEYTVNLPTYWKWEHILSRAFSKRIDLSITVIRNPNEFYLSDEAPKLILSILRRLPLFILKLLLPFFKSWITICIKR